jgi:NAD(P)-dependent dehydrogenase (short-subunit alcohol dehydrogenase family)
MELGGKVAVVTGASSGIGEASAKTLADAGMTVVIVARRGERLKALADADPRLRPRPADVGDDDEVAQLAAWVHAELGACHVLVNNAGLNAGKAFRDWRDVEEVSRVMETNFFGAVRCMAAFGELLTRSAPSRVINVGSVAGKVDAGMAGYGAAKFALVGFSENVRAHWLRRGVAVGQLNPGLIRTEGFPQHHLRGTPLDRLVGQPEDVARALVAMARSGSAERTVPRWYRALVLLRHLAPPVWRTVSGRL